MRKHFKILKIFALSTAVTLPFASLACSNNSTEHFSKMVQDRAPKSSEQGVSTIDVTDWDNPEIAVDYLVDDILGILNVRMPKPGNELSPTDEVKFNYLRDEYINKINIDSYYKIQIINGNKEYMLDFSSVADQVKLLKEFANRTVAWPTMQANQTLKLGYNLGIEAKTNFNAINYSKLIKSSALNIAMVDFLNMIEQKPKIKITTKLTQQMMDADFFTYGGGPYNMPININPLTNALYKVGDDVEVEITESQEDTIARHPYLQMLNAYHDVLYEFTKSEFFKEWVRGKQYNIILNDSAIAVGNTRDKEGYPAIANPGDWYDIENPSAQSEGIRKKLKVADRPETFATESSNLEFVFFYHLLHFNN